MGAGKSQFIAIVDDDEFLRRALSSLLRSDGLKPYVFASAEEFLHSDDLSDFACVITDVRMGGMTGLELQNELARQRFRAPIIFVTAHADPRTRMLAMRAGAIGFLEKPFDDRALLEIVHSALGK